MRNHQHRENGITIEGQKEPCYLKKSFIANRILAKSF